jgi:mitochondrial import inner membrane translocase subunit TIM17
MGAIGGAIWHTIKGARLAPVGSRIHGAITAVQARSPVLGGQFAVWGGIFACCDCSISYLRQKVRQLIFEETMKSCDSSIMFRKIHGIQ